MKVKITRYYSDQEGNRNAASCKDCCIEIYTPDTSISEFTNKRLNKPPKRIEITLNSADQIWPIKNGVKELISMGDGRFQVQESIVIDQEDVAHETV